MELETTIAKDSRKRKTAVRPGGHSQKPAADRSSRLTLAKEQALSQASSLARRNLTETFGNEGGCSHPPIDAVLMAPLRTALASFSYDLDVALQQRGLLSRSLSSALNMARFISVVLPAVRGAQSESEIPASILLADAYLISGPKPDFGTSNDVFKTREKFGSLEESFVARGYWMKRQAAFQEVLRAATNPREYIEQLSRCELWDEMDRMDRLDLIAEHGLLEIDALRR